MWYYCIYKVPTGEIIELCSSNSDRPYPNRTLASGLGSSLIYSDTIIRIKTHKLNVAAESFEAKVNMPILSNKTSIQGNGIDTCIFSQIPAGTLVASSELKIYETINDGSVELSVDAPGKYQLTFSHPLYLDTEAKVIAT